MIIAVVGMPGSGKSVFCEVVRGRGLPIVYFGGQVLKELERREMALTPENERRVRQELRDELGMDAMAKLALPELREYVAQGRDMAIDGVYSFSEFRTLKAEFGELLEVVAICAPRRLRHRRLAERPERPLSPEQANSRDYHEIERMEKGGPIAIADHYLLNEEGEARFRAEVEALLDRLLPATAAER